MIWSLMSSSSLTDLAILILGPIQYSLNWVENGSVKCIKLRDDAAIGQQH